MSCGRALINCVIVCQYLGEFANKLSFNLVELNQLCIHLFTGAEANTGHAACRDPAILLKRLYIAANRFLVEAGQLGYQRISQFLVLRLRRRPDALRLRIWKFAVFSTNPV